MEGVWKKWIVYKCSNVPIITFDKFLDNMEGFLEEAE